MIDNWGCEDFISLNGIEFFNSDAEFIKVENEDIKLKIHPTCKTRHSNSENLFQEDFITQDIKKVWMIVNKKVNLPKI